MLSPRIEALGLDLTHLAPHVTAGTFEIILRHAVGMRVARLADEVNKNLHLNCGASSRACRVHTGVNASRSKRAKCPSAEPASSAHPGPGTWGLTNDPFPDSPSPTTTI